MGLLIPAFNYNSFTLNNIYLCLTHVEVSKEFEKIEQRWYYCINSIANIYTSTEKTGSPITTMIGFTTSVLQDDIYGMIFNKIKETYPESIDID